MKKNLVEYFESIGLTGLLLTKVEPAFHFYTNFIGMQITDAFISEFINKDGSRVYENIWFFNDDFCGEAKSFMTNEEYDFQIIKDTISYFNITKKEYNIVDDQINDNSRMTLEFGLPDDRLGDLKASKENCKQLTFIFKKYIHPNCSKPLKSY